MEGPGTGIGTSSWSALNKKRTFPWRYAGAAVAVEERDLESHYRALPLLNARLSTLPRALRRIAKYILENPDLAIHQTASELAIVTNSGPASIVRFCKVIGFSGLQDFKLALAGDLASRRLLPAERNAEQTNTNLTQELTERIIEATRETQLLLDQTAVSRLANAMLSARRIDVYGSAVSGLVAQHLAFRLLRIGMPAHAIIDTTYATYVSGGLSPTSVVIAVADSGISKDTADALKTAKSAGAFTAVITHWSGRPILKYADEVLLTAGSNSHVTEANSIIAFTHLIAIDVLASTLTIKLNMFSSTRNVT